ncbi:PQQ-binding-like beta-propeller repeat protein [Streptomyces griseiscabiei]|uniref:Uncharacterized protein n=1 Tax=Streptomyces griseiscabiei TaxID=2993540 RepID=A0ABU4KYI2_9ACTN|nr:hypothetical protein [Streptomyces griseiscabiei]MBZ3904556.1 hypothetical protein [Streptomyces griseiscabiei]MDX2908305.1 hypothetical protein [Streptomyces griseiscabiei]
MTTTGRTTTGMTTPSHVTRFRLDRVLGDRPFAEIGDPALTVEDEGRRLLAVAGASGMLAGLHGYGRITPVGVYGTDDLACRALLRARHPVHALAFHPRLPLLAVGTGHYDGGYFFEGELLLLDLESGTATSLIEHALGRQVLGLEWLDDQRLRVLMAPPDDWDDEDAWAEGHVAVVCRPDWRAVPPRSVTDEELAGPRVAAPRPDGQEHARRTLSALTADWDPRRNVRAAEELSDGRILTTLDGVGLESWSPGGSRQWTVPDDGPAGGRDLVVAADERSVWVGLKRPAWESRPQSVLRLALDDGTQLDHLTPSAPVSVLRGADGRPALAPAGLHGETSALRIRRGSRIYFRETVRAKGEEGPDPGEAWLYAADPAAAPAADRPREPAPEEIRKLFPYSWVPGETHYAGPGIETGEGDLIHAGTVYHGHGLRPGGSFVVRRSATTGEPAWVFRTDRRATALDADPETVYIAYDDGEIVALDPRDGTVRERRRPTVGAVSVLPTALTVTASGRLLIGTGDGRILVCSPG